MKKLLSFILFVKLIVLMLRFNKLICKLNIQESSSSIHNCEYLLPNGKYYNLLPMRSADDYIYRYKKYLYKANFCGSLVMNNCSPDLDVPAAVYLNGNYY